MVLTTYLDLVRHHAALLICMLSILTTIRAANNGTHNKRGQAWTYEHIPTAQPKSDPGKSHTHIDAHRPYQ
jgi:hypothetical protein